MRTTCVNSKGSAKSNDSDYIFGIRENTRLKHRCPFKILGAVVPEKSLIQISLYYTGVRDGKKEKQKEDKNESQHLDFLSNNILGHSQGVYKI